MDTGEVIAREIGWCCTGTGADCINAAGADVSGDVDSVTPTLGTKAEVRFAGGWLSSVDKCEGKLATAVRSGTLGGTILGIVPSIKST